ncbi:hypothetical protein CHCC20327_0900 [Bacillus licheniformis]|nr:hypothetical protein CHCC20487_3135 [Bacillus licheniformis]TWK96331.1 hypothetical protein CHCC20327_0900 [Bacillus licheniformis]
MDETLSHIHFFSSLLKRFHFLTIHHMLLIQGLLRAKKLPTKSAA